jgi:TonB dependent receptor/TonB-dependent Receptor Plug Domain
MRPRRSHPASRFVRLGRSAPAVALCVAALAVAPARAADPRCEPPGEAPAAAGSAAPSGSQDAAQEPKQEQPKQEQAKQEQPKQGQPKQGQPKQEQEKDHAAAGGQEKLQVYEQILVTGRGSDMVGIAASASQGVVGPQELEQRPILRPGEVLETVPGLIVSQHSGDGKANQYFLRGFNLDHGTDFSITVDGIPINQPTNGHGQGYSDLNFLIPELVDTVRYEKGLYYADKGDFSAAGAADITFKNALDQGLVEATGGTHGFARGLLADSAKVGRGDLLAAIEYEHYDGPWVRPDDYQKQNGLVRYNSGDAANGFTVTMQGYDGTWNSTDQIPSRAVREGLVSRLGGIDPTDGGSSRRYSLAGEVRRGGDASLTTLSAFVYDTRLRLFSDFTYFLDDPVHGDQFEQFDDRTVEGVKLEHQWAWRLFGRDVEGELGLQARHDGIHNGILHTEDRSVLSTTREDTIQETSVGPYGQAQVRWTGWLRTIAGLRADAYRFSVDSNLAANSGFRNRAIAEPKLSLLLGPWQASEVYLNFGEGFHSNDARGATITVDPRTGQPVGPVSPLVRAKSADAGFRTSLVPGLQTSITFFRLDLASELVFDGDAGDTAPSRPSRRLGFELQSFYRPSRWLALDADYSRSQARFTDFAVIGDHIPGAIGSAAAIGATVPDVHRFFGSLRWRYFGPRPLIEDASVRSHSTSLFYLDAGCTLPRNLRLTVEVFNLFNVKASDVDYYYISRLPGEPAAGVPDVHFHPAEPRSVRLVAAYRF